MDKKMIDFSKTTHILLSCGWVTVDKGSFDGKGLKEGEGLVVIKNQIAEDVYINSMFKFKSENKTIIVPLTSILAVKFSE